MHVKPYTLTVRLASSLQQLQNVKVINRFDSDLPVPGKAFQSEIEAVKFCELSEKQCKAIYKSTETLNSFVTLLEPAFLLSWGEMSTLYVKPGFMANLGK